MTRENEVEDLLRGLNPPQREAVLHQRGPLLILAGAGSGKTRVIVHRIAHLVRTGTSADRLLAITFTNKAAGEMRERTTALCGGAGPWISTFHSFCARLLRRHIDLLAPYENNFSIYDTDDCRSVLKIVCDELEIPKEAWTPRKAHEEISWLKNTAGRELESTFGGDYLHGQVLRRIYHAYAEKLERQNAVDFDDLLLLTVRLFEEHPAVLERYQDQFLDVLIDEFQDTNAIQYRIGRLLTATRRNLCITGDPDQSIYRWRGAELTNMLSFERDYPDAKVVLLEQNYRSSQSVLHAANALIAHNTLRKPKSLWSTNPQGEPVRVYRFVDEDAEAHEVADLIRRLGEDGFPLGDIAVFYRINALSRAIEQALIHANLPYSIVGGTEYFQRKEVKDLLAYLKVLENPRDTAALLRIINVPARGIGESTLEKVVRHAESSGGHPLEALLAGNLPQGLGRRAFQALAGFVAIYRELAALRDGSLGDLVTGVIRRTEFESHLEATQGERAREVIANAWELVTAASRFESQSATPTLGAFLEAANLLGDSGRWEEEPERVKLMTLHAAKGLEFPAVIILGVEDGLLPLQAGDDPDPDVEEERRLLYVGMTRAMKQLYLSHVESRARHGRPQRSYPSPFIAELQPGKDAPAEARQAVELDDETRRSLVDDKSLFDDDLESWRPGSRRTASQEWDALDPMMEEPEEDPDGLAVGTRVLHATYGEGEIVRISGIGQRRRVTIRFDDGAEKLFVPGIAPLRRLR